MFDDYAHKHTQTRIGVRFIQRRDEPMYPWEIAGFLNNLNTVYYKYELLNSICSAINSGILKSEIFILDKSLPLYQRHSGLNLLNEGVAAEFFYPIGLAYPLDPTIDIYGLNLISKAFYLTNSFLTNKKIRPLAVKNISSVYETLRKEGLTEAEEHILDLAESRAKDSFDSATKKKLSKELVTRDQIKGCLAKYYSQRKILLDDIDVVSKLTTEQKVALTKSKSKNDKRRTNLILSFFRHFEKTSRPLVCVRVSPGQFRVLGRSLVNKKERTGLELKEATRNSPLSAVFEGGVALYQAIQQEKRANEIHKLDVENKNLQNKLALEKIEEQRLKNLTIKIDIARKLDDLANTSDIKAKNELADSFAKLELLNAYLREEKSAYSLLNRRGLEFDGEYTKIIDVEA